MEDLGKILEYSQGELEKKTLEIGQKNIDLNRLSENIKELKRKQGEFYEC